MKKTMLTYRTLDRFERIVNLDTLTDAQIREVEHCAYCANMGRESEDGAWKWFCHLIQKYLGIALEN